MTKSAAPEAPHTPSAEEIAACNRPWDEEEYRALRDAYARIPETEEERRWAEYLFELSMRELPPW
jgi:hypothetical protein